MFMKLNAGMYEFMWVYIYLCIVVFRCGERMRVCEMLQG